MPLVLPNKLLCGDPIAEFARFNFLFGLFVRWYVLKHGIVFSFEYIGRYFRNRTIGPLPLNMTVDGVWN